MLESTKMYLQNRIERDAKLLASISIFAWERALKDVGRALPSAGKSGARVANQVKKTILSLSNNSSFVQNGMNSDQNQNPFLLSSSSAFLKDDNVIDEEKNIYDELTTPGDEIQKVSESIRDILSGKGVSSDRGLRSVAPAGTARSAERQRAAFARRKETTLKREKEGIDKKAMRAASSVTDAAWEIKREMQIEGNEAGYRSEAAMKSLEASIASSALMEGGKNWIDKRLPGKKKDSLKLESSTSSQEDNMKVKFQNAKIDEIAVVDTILDAVVVEPEVIVPDVVAPEPKVIVPDVVAAEPKVIVPDAAVVETQVIVPDTAGLDPEWAQIDDESTVLASEKNEMEMLVEEITEAELYEERVRMITVLQMCLEEPDQTWLSPDLLPVSIIEAQNEKEDQDDTPYFLSPDDNGKSSTEKLWEKVITAMVSAKNELEAVSTLESKEKSQEDKIAELYEMKGVVDKITDYVEESAGIKSADFLRMELLGESSSLYDESNLLSSLNGSTKNEEQKDSSEKIAEIDVKDTKKVVEMQSMSKDEVTKDSNSLDGLKNNFDSNLVEEKKNIDVVNDNAKGFTRKFETAVVPDIIPNEDKTSVSSNFDDKFDNVDVPDVTQTEDKPHMRPEFDENFKTVDVADDIPKKDKRSMKSNFDKRFETVVVADVIPNEDKRSMKSDFDDVLETEVVVDVMPSEDKRSLKSDFTSNDIFETVVVADVLPSEEDPHMRTPFATSKKVQTLYDVDFEVKTSKGFGKSTSNEYDDGFSVAHAEVLTSDNDDVMKDTEPMNSAAVEEEPVESKKKQNAVVTFTLRTLDISLFIVEKTITVSSCEERN